MFACKLAVVNIAKHSGKYWKANLRGGRDDMQRCVSSAGHRLTAGVATSPHGDGPNKPGTVLYLGRV